MRLFVLGATGRIGTEILQLAAARSHDVTAFVRSPDKLNGVNGTVRVVAGNPLDWQAVAAALPDHDAVLSTIGPPPRDGLRPCTLMTDSARSTLRAMQESGVKRLAIVSAAVLFPEKGVLFALFRWLLRHHARDLSAMEQAVRASDLDWTIARPPRLTASPEARFRVLCDGLPPGGLTVSTRSVATFLLDAVERRSHRQQIVGLAR